VAAIARDKLGVVRDTTRSIVSIRQDHPDVLEVYRVWTAAGRPKIELLADTADDQGWPPALAGPNARLGCAAAHRLLAAVGAAAPAPDRLRTVLRSVNPLGRLSRHVDAERRQWTVDAAVDERGVRAAVEWHEARVGPIDTLLVCLPTGKDVAGVRRALAGRSVVPVRIAAAHLTFGDPGWEGREIDFSAIDPTLRGPCILAVGTWTFVGAVLARLGVRYENAFSP
jgi:dihydrofolate synthase/folylpolyglutamate synthase